MDIRELDRQALALTGDAIAKITPDRLSLPTPCPDWTLHGLIRHLISQNEGFAAAAGGHGSDLPVWRNGRLGDDPYGDYQASADLVTTAFSADGVLDREFDLPEVRSGGGFPAPMAISFHFVDYVVHGWDVAATIGLPWEPGDDLTAAALTVAAMVPATPGSRGPGLAFDQRVDISDGAPAHHRLLAALGRSPSWTAF